MRILFSLITIFIIINLSVASAFAQATKWPINKYKIVQQDPTKVRVPYSIEILSKDMRLTQAQVSELERYFVKVGEKYQAEGFLQPQITTLTKERDAFEIFVYQYNNKTAKGAVTAPARFGPQCSYKEGKPFKPSRRYLYLDVDRILAGNSIAPITYDNIAHEMFHAIQYGYPLFAKDIDNSCTIGEWIHEGTAEAVGADMARTLKGVKIDKIKMGPRNYSMPLYEGLGAGKARNKAYWTSSLWRYIGEYKANGKSFPPAKQNKSPDYRYLQKFFLRSIPKPSEESELDWLETNLNTEFGLSVANLYANFITTFAHYLPDRLKPDNNESLGKFRKQIFQGCERVTLTSDITSFDTAGREFSKVSARCFEVFYDGPEDKLDIGIYMESDKKTVNSIQQIGVQYHTNSGDKTIKVLKSLKGDWSPDEHYGDWVFQNVPFVRHSGSRTKSNIFVISNVSKWASESHPNPIVSFNVSYAKSSGTMNVTSTGP